MSTEGNYYVPEQSKLPLAAALGMGTMAFGAASWVIEGKLDPFLDRYGYHGSCDVQVVEYCD